MGVGECDTDKTQHQPHQIDGIQPGDPRLEEGRDAHPCGELAVIGMRQDKPAQDKKHVHRQIHERRRVGIQHDPGMARHNGDGACPAQGIKR